jgi:dTDP-4-amino-4,6-dideoxygalactose transaminase
MNHKESWLSGRKLRIEDELRMEHILNALDHGVPFSAIKLCHGFWEKCVRMERSLENPGSTQSLDNLESKELIDQFFTNWPLDLFQETIPYLNKAHQYPNVLTLVSHLGWSKGYETEGTPYVGIEDTKRQISKYLSPKVRQYDGLFWKNSIQDGTFVSFIDSLRNRPVIVVGPSYVENFITFSGFRKAAFVEVHTRKAAWFRNDTLQSVSEQVEKMGESGVVCLIEAGGLTSSWLVYRLSQRYPASYFFSLGQALNIGSWGNIRNTNWYAVHHQSINRTITTMNRKWATKESKEHFSKQGVNVEEKLYLNIRLKNYEPAVFQIVDRLSEKTEKSAIFPVPFIENKSIDELILKQILQASRDHNHWANFGPVVKMLEEAIWRILELPEQRCVLSCKSATDAILALVGMHEFKAGRELNWVVCAFGFFSTRLGPLSRASIVDCDQNGIISLSELKQLDPGAWDGVIVTNPFSLADDLSPIVDLARSQGKKVIVDNAAAMFTPTRRTSRYPDEVISFHQTKPWGIGEGGCAIVDSADKHILRSLTNFGVGLGETGRKYAQNSKMSDFDAALILQRLVNLPNWRHHYQLQKRRIMSIAETLELKLLKPAPAEFLSAHVPLLVPKNVHKNDLENSHLTLRKYYQPLAEGFPQAQLIYDRIVCVPCHPAVAECPTHVIEKLLEGIAK